MQRNMPMLTLSEEASTCMDRGGRTPPPTPPLGENGQLRALAAAYRQLRRLRRRLPRVEAAAATAHSTSIGNPDRGAMCSLRSSGAVPLGHGIRMAAAAAARWRRAAARRVARLLAHDVLYLCGRARPGPLKLAVGGRRLPPACRPASVAIPCVNVQYDL